VSKNGTPSPRRFPKTRDTNTAARTHHLTATLPANNAVLAGRWHGDQRRRTCKGYAGGARCCTQPFRST
jgi:hypothetical protein